MSNERNPLWYGSMRITLILTQQIEKFVTNRLISTIDDIDHKFYVFRSVCLHVCQSFFFLINLLFCFFGFGLCCNFDLLQKLQEIENYHNTTAVLYFNTNYKRIFVVAMRERTTSECPDNDKIVVLKYTQWFFFCFKNKCSRCADLVPS